LDAGAATTAITDELDASDIPTSLTNAINAAFRDLGVDAVVTVVQAGASWLIDDDNRRFGVTVDAGRIAVVQQYFITDGSSAIITALNGQSPSVPGSTKANFSGQHALSNNASVSVIQSGVEWRVNSKLYAAQRKRNDPSL
jgi:hypothetical protein